ncbi:MAG: hypothetical protein E4H03_09505, partial [Myxococcales bacterium]
LSPKENLRYLDIYPSNRWETTVMQILDSQIDGDDASAVQEALLANYIHPAQEALLDKQGRILIPQEHRSAAGLTKDVVYTGDIKKFRLWALDDWTRYREEAEQQKQKIKGLKGVWI